ncbi:hypothetical protein DK26_07990 [Bosea sp. WAO]|uniref:hypothetical protein n=1 Tax=Bosea sp. WAO TaxID=406341 RepID=UPI00074ABBEF|nr:hypothetical protein [Bosea sp. WAO]KUL95968.1 hypothetical protein DK26_07990 [Bosea sp. WAO]
MSDRPTSRQKQQALARKFGFRRRVYATREAADSMKEAEAAFQIGIFEEMEAEMRQRAEAVHRARRLL